MSLQVDKLEHNMAKLTVEVPAEELEKAIEKVYQKSKKSISVPGFRKGKAPRKMIERMYGTGVFLEDAVNDLLPDAYAKAAEESELEITSRPAVDITQVEPGQPLIFTAEVALKPDVILGEYKGIEVEKADVEVTDAEIEEELHKGEKYRGVEVDATLLPKVKVEVVVSAIPVDDVIEAAKKVLYTGHIGDGKIFVYDVGRVVKIRTGEENEAALQDVE